MQEKNSEKTFSYYLDEIRRIAENLKKYPDGTISDTGSIIDDNIGELKKALKGIRIVLLFLSAVTIISVVSLLTVLSSDKIRSYLAGEKSALKDSLLDLHENDEYIRYRTNKGKIITYQSLIKTNDSLDLKIINLKSELSLAKSDLELCNLLLKNANQNLDFYKENSDYYEGEVSKRNREDLKNSINNIKKIDSGKILLNMLRHNLKYDQKTKTWSVHIEK